MSKSPVSVVIPAKDRPELLSRALQSALTQSISPLEVIVVDDGSAVPLSRNLAAELLARIYLVRYEKGVNAAHARNIGLDVAIGDWVAFLDSDDWWAPFHLEHCLRLIRERNAIGLFGRYWAVAFAGGRSVQRPAVIPSHGDTTTQYLLLKGGSTRTSTMLFRRDAANRIRFDPRLQRHQDWDFVMRAEDYGLVCFNAEPTVYIDHAATGRMSGSSKVETTRYLYLKHRDKLTRAERVALLSRVARHALENGDGPAARLILSNLEDRLDAIEAVRIGAIWVLSLHNFFPRSLLVLFRLAQRIRNARTHDEPASPAP